MHFFLHRNWNILHNQVPYLTPSFSAFFSKSNVLILKYTNCNILHKQVSYQTPSYSHSYFTLLAQNNEDYEETRKPIDVVSAFSDVTSQTSCELKFSKYIPTFFIFSSTLRGLPRPPNLRPYLDLCHKEAHSFTITSMWSYAAFCLIITD